jgi:DnaJ-class molecular chaperone
MPRKRAVVVDPPCETCEGEGAVEAVIRVGRKSIPGQLGICPTCLGFGAAPPADHRPQGRPHP